MSSPGDFRKANHYSSAITDHVTKQCSSDESVATVYYFFNFSNAREHSLISLLCSIISQLANRTAEIPRSLVNFYYHKNQKYLASHHPASILMELVQEIITEFSQVYIILDALDECNNCDEILRFLDVTLDWKSGKLHWLVSSRPQRDIEEHMVNRSTAQLSLRGSHLDGDIHLFILDRLQNDPKLKRLSKEVKVEVERTLIERAQGM